MTQAPLFTDPSCYHAAFATVLRATDPTADPFQVLGGNAATAARLGEDGLLRFSDPLEPLTAVFARHRYDLVQHPVHGPEQWREAAEALRSGRTVAVAADAFHLEHYWVGHRTSHALHVVVLQDYDPADRSVRLLDPGEVVFFDGRVPLGSLEPAMCSADVGQAWMELTSRHDQYPDDPAATAGLLAEGLAGTGTAPDWISGTALVHALSLRLDTYLDLVGNRPRGGAGGQIDWGVGQWLPLGLWWYHHTLRWLGIHLGSGTVEQASRDLLVVRNLMMRLGVMNPESLRASTFRSQLATRLDSAGEHLAAAGRTLSEQGAAR